MAKIVTLDLQNPDVLPVWQRLLQTLGLQNFTPAEVAHLDFTLGLYDDQQLVATASAAGNVIQYVGVNNEDQVSGSRFNTIISAVTNRLFQKQIFHIFVFTKPQYSRSFQHVGFHELTRSPQAAFLETGTPDVHDYLAQIPDFPAEVGATIAGIVMNANPFTWGHRYLIEQALQASDAVYVFVVNTDASLFTTAERQQLVEAGTADLKKVIVVNGGDYMVSYATFPAYFLPSTEATIQYQTTLDAQIFRDIIAPACHIKVRFVGTEPLSKTTGIYNQVLAEILPPQVALKVIDRKKDDQNHYVTATQVRQQIAAGQLDDLASLVPPSTYQFIQRHAQELHQRIQKGQQIHGN